jgi:cell division protein FtsZ
MNRRKFLKNIALAAAGIGGVPVLSYSSSGSVFPTIGTNHTRFLVMGIGGAGGNTVSGLLQLGVSLKDLIKVNTDKQALANDRLIRKILIGKNVTSGKGTGDLGQPDLGRRAVLENETDIKKLIADVKILFITAGLGGGTGSGVSPVVAQWAQDSGCIAVGLFSTPFCFEGKRRMNNAIKSLEQFTRHSDMIYVVSNDLLRKLANPDEKFAHALRRWDKIYWELIKSCCC